MNVIVPLLVFVTLGIGAIIAAIKQVPEEERPALARMLFIAFALRVTIAATFELLPELRYFHEDANGYEGWAVRLSNAWRGTGPPFPFEGVRNTGFFYVGGIICFVFGPFPLNVSLFNAVIGTLTIFLIYSMSRKLFHISVARRAAMLIAYMPSMILWSSIALKDALTTFLIVLALLCCVSLKEKLTFKAMVGLVLSIAAIQPIRFYIVYFVAFSVVMAFAIERRGQILGRLYKQLLVAGAVMGFFALLGLSGQTVEGTEFFDLRFVNGFRSGMASTANSGFAQDVDISTPSAALSFFPIGLATLVLAPFPWQMTSFRTLIAAPETVFWWLLFPATLRGIVFVIRRKLSESSPLLLFMFSLTGAYALVQGNVGSAFRQRAQIFVFLFIFTSIGTYLRKCRKLGIDPAILLKGK